MRRIFCILLALLALVPVAHAEDDWRVAEGMPVLEITWRDTGESTGNDRRPYRLAADITAEDGSLTQTVTWLSAEANDRMAAHVRLVDYNFDGYKDLQLLTAQGARNVFYAVALWNEEKDCFDEVEQHVRYMPGGKFEDKLVQAEFCNPEFLPNPGNPSSGYILCVEEDGFYYRTEWVYGWVGHDSLETYEVASIYDAGDGMIGESLDQWVQDLNNRLWDQAYPEDWYYGTDASDDRRSARRYLMLSQERYIMQVSNVSWVNLRQLDRKDSPSLAQLNRGVTVQVLATGCGEDGGWVLVYCSGDALGLPGDTDAHNDYDVVGMTGYIWHSYLEPCFMSVANVDWVNVREKADKQSAVVAKLDKGTKVSRSSGDEKDGWIPVSGWLPDAGFFSGYIWHSYLEAEEFMPYR